MKAKISRWAQKLSRRLWIDPDTRVFIEHEKRKWGRRPFEKKESVVLIDLFDLNPVIYCFSEIGNYLAKRTGASLATFHFAHSRLSRWGLKERRLEKIFESFGAGLELTLSRLAERPYRKAADEFAQKTFADLREKTDLLAVEINGLRVGDLIYDSYLRAGRPTVDLKDPALRALIREAYLVFRLVQKFLDERDVQAILTSHAVYVSHGILTRLAIERGIPVYALFHFDILRITEIPRETYYHHPYHTYKATFDSLPDDRKEEFRAEARAILTDRFKGKIDRGIADMILEEGRPGLAGYGQGSDQRLMKETGRPRILVMLPCFFDAPHCYRSFLFPDFWEWACFILDKAAETPFDWYVKPHPAGLPENDRMIEILRAKYPKVTFFGRDTSNRQLLEEGVNAMFTAYGTAAHELAYMGVPVVNGGDNPHINYSFNLNPESIAEFEGYVRSADRLQIDIKKSEIEEFFYMHYIYCYRPNDFGARCVDEEFEYGKLGYRVNEPRVLRGYVKGDRSEKDHKLKLYFDQYFSERFPL